MYSFFDVFVGFSAYTTVFTLNKLMKLHFVNVSVIYSFTFHVIIIWSVFFRFIPMFTDPVKLDILPKQPFCS